VWDSTIQSRLEPDARQPGADIALVTGANGFIGRRLVRALLGYGVARVRCFCRPAIRFGALKEIERDAGAGRIEIVTGNLTSKGDCQNAVRGVDTIYHLAAGTDKTFPGCVLNSAVTTRNLLDASVRVGTVKRFVNVSSLAVYANDRLRRSAVLDETCPVDERLIARHDPYAYGKAQQDRLVLEYAQMHGLAYVIVRPGVTFGPGKAKIPGRVGIDTFGPFLHLGLGNAMPLTYVDNCADAIALAGLKPGIEGQTINVIDDDLPTSAEFLRMYKQKVRRFRSLAIPYPAFYAFNYLWEKYAQWSNGQLPPVFNRLTCAAYYRGNTYSNANAKRLLGWAPRIPMAQALERFFGYAREVNAQ
jgi:nucleoside-diphosphate-sugar epimerase